jgi:hypothetical protein
MSIISKLLSHSNIMVSFKRQKSPLNRGLHGRSDEQLATGDMHELIIWQKIQAEQDKAASTKHGIAGDEPAMRTGATNGDSELLHN